MASTIAATSSKRKRTSTLDNNIPNAKKTNIEAKDAPSSIETRQAEEFLSDDPSDDSGEDPDPESDPEEEESDESEEEKMMATCRYCYVEFDEMANFERGECVTHWGK